MIVQKVVSSRKFATDVASSRFRQADKLKMGFKNYVHDMATATSAGKVEILNVILQSHLDNPYRSVDEFVGDLQMLTVHSWNELQQLNPNMFVPVTIEKVLHDSGIST